MAFLNMTSYLLTWKYFNKTDINVKGTNSPLENGMIWYILKRETRNTENQKMLTLVWLTQHFFDMFKPAYLLFPSSKQIMPYHSKWKVYVLSIANNFIENSLRQKIWRHIQNGHFLLIFRIKCNLYDHQMSDNDKPYHYFHPQIKLFSMDILIFQNIDIQKSKL